MWQDTVKKHFKHRMDKEEITLKTCPYCGNTRYNFQINSIKGIFNCWVCSASGRVEKFFKDQNLEFDKTGWQSTATVSNRTPEILNFDGFIPIQYNIHAKFLLSRGLLPEDVYKYDLLTTNYGKYKGKLVIPLKEGNDVVYFVAKEMAPKGRYTNPIINKRDFLLYYLGTENKMRLYIVEGAFDAISVNKVGFSAAMLLGSSISKEQIAKIKRTGFKEVVVCLDGDLKKKAISLYEKLQNSGIITKIIFIPGKDDPNELYVADREYLKKLLDKPQDVTIKDKVDMALCGDKK